VDESELLEGILEPDTVYDFCMCNPPFYSSTEELDPKNVARTPNRPAPRNAHSGTPTELVAPGGETAFVAAIIQDSNKLKTTVRIYSVMLGHKSSVEKVKNLLQDSGITSASVTTSEFCQGRTMRWGVAWTLDPTITFPLPTTDGKKKFVPLSHTFQSDLTSTVDRLKVLLEQLQITYKILKSNQDLCAMEIKAVENTWSSSRKKRRQEKLKQKLAETNENNIADTPNVIAKPVNGEPDKNIVVSEDSKIKTSTEEEGTVDKTGANIAEAGGTSKEKITEDCGTNVDKEEDQMQMLMVPMSVEEDLLKVTKNSSKRSLPEDESSNSSDLNPLKKCKSEESASGSNMKEKPKTELIFHGTLSMEKCADGTDVKLKWLRGSGGKDSANQVLQYLRNHFNPAQFQS